jgi:hypothetical protein
MIPATAGLSLQDLWLALLHDPVRERQPGPVEATWLRTLKLGSIGAPAGMLRERTRPSAGSTAVGGHSQASHGTIPRVPSPSTRVELA